MNKYLLAFVFSFVAALSSNAQETVIRTGGGGTVSGSITGAYSFSAGFTTANATNISLLPAISNLAVNLPATQASGGLTLSGGLISLDATISNLVSNLANTNKFNQWQIWADPAVTNRYHAENRALNLKTNSTDFSALLQSIFNRGTEGYSIKVEPNPFYTNAYVMSNTVTITNWGSVMGASAGNPTVVFRAASGFTNYLFQLGTVGVQIGGISSWRDIRFEGDQGANNSGGIHLVNCVEPVIDRCEFTGFKETSFWVDTTNKLHWTFVNLTWFVGKSSSHTAIKFTRQPIEEIALNHFIITDSHFGGVGKGIVVSNHWSNIRIARNTFFSGMGAGVELYGGDRYQIIDNQFVGFTAGIPIYFMDQAGATNFNSEAFGNRTDTDGPVVVLGDFIQGVRLGLNSSKGGTDPVFFTGNNGGINNIDQTGVTATSILTTGRNTNTSGGFWTTDVSGFVSLTDINNYFLLSQPQGGLFATLDNWVFGLSGVNIANWSTNTSGVASNWSVGGSMFLPLLPNQGTIGTDANGKIVAGTGGGSGGTNSPAVLLQAGNTNLTGQSGNITAHYQATNGSHGLDFDLAAPVSGQTFRNFETNSAATNYVVTFYTNGVAGKFYNPESLTNETSFIVPAGALTMQEFVATTPGNWTMTRHIQPVLRPVFSTGLSVVTNGVNGLDAVITATATGGGSSSQTNIALSVTASTNLVIDLGYASSNLVTFNVAALTNFHLVWSNASLRRFPVEVNWQQDSNGIRTVLSQSSTDGVIQIATNSAPLTLTTNANYMDKWVVSSSYFPTNITVSAGAIVYDYTGSGAMVRSNTPTIYVPTLVFPTIQDANIDYGVSWGVGNTTGTGGANTNFTLFAYGSSSRPVRYIDAGTTNVNIVAIMLGQPNTVNRGAVILTNRTATSRNLSLSSVTNNWISLQDADGGAGYIAPFVVTNSRALRLEWEILGTNVYYKRFHHALPTF